MDVMGALYRAAAKVNQTITIRNDRKIYTLSFEAVGEFGFEAIDCVLGGYTYIPISDGDIIKHGIDHIRFMLL